MKKVALSFLILIFLLIILWFFRAPLLRAAGNLLIHEDKLIQADAIVVLSGGAFERGTSGASLFKNGYAKKIICPGGNIDYTYLILYNDTLFESDITKMRIVKSGVADSLVVAVHSGQSTYEEAKGILDYCRKNKIKSIIVVSTYFHTSRVNRVYKNIFCGSGIKVIIRGANSAYFDEQKWWQNEYGLISFNNEILKSVYYLFKDY